MVLGRLRKTWVVLALGLGAACSCNDKPAPCGCEGGVCLEDGSCPPEVVDECTVPCPANLVCEGASCREEACVDVACPQGEACAAGQCLPVDCATGKCLPGQVCANGSCADATCVATNCGQDACSYGLCVPKSCGGTTCPAGFACGADGRCVGTLCLGVSCPEGKACVDGQCVPKSCGGVTCAEGQGCFEGSCTTSGCTGAVCGAGEVCVSGACQKKNCGALECPPTTFCLGGECASLSCANVSCTPGTRCANGQCLSETCGGASCGEEEVCLASACRDALCVGLVCPQGQVCKSGACTTMADRDGDGMLDRYDNCPDAFNPSQVDTDHDFAGAACDCDDSSAQAYPGHAEMCSDGKDNDCDGLRDCADPDCATACSTDAGPDAGVDGGACPPADAGSVTDSGLGDGGSLPWHWEAVCELPRPPPPPPTLLDGVFVAGPTDVWVRRGAEVSRWNGSSLNAVEGPLPRWGAAADDLWAPLGTDLAHWNGTTWTRESVWPLCGSGPAVADVHGSSSSDVWAVGDKLVARWNGASWSVAPTLVQAKWTGVWAFAPTEAWVVGPDAKWPSLRWNGSVWLPTAQPHSLPLSSGAPPSVFGATPSEVWVGTAGVFGSSATDAWSYVSGQPAQHWNGGTWTAQGAAITSAHGRGSEVWAVQGLEVLRWNGSGWENRHTVVLPPPPDAGAECPSLYGLWGSPGGSLWSVSGYATAFEWDAGRPVDHAITYDEMWTQYGVAGTSPTDVWVLLYFNAHHWNGAAWEAYAHNGYSRAIWARTPTDAWMAGMVGQTHQWNGSAWVVRSSGNWSQDLRGVWGASATDVWAVGTENASGALNHWNGSAWTSTSFGTDWWGVWGFGASDVWVVGAGEVARFNGTSWSLVAPPTTGRMVRVRGTSSSDVWVDTGQYEFNESPGTFDGRVYRWNGAAWADLGGVSTGLEVFGPTDAWMATESGLYRFVP